MDKEELITKALIGLLVVLAIVALVFILVGFPRLEQDSQVNDSPGVSATDDIQESDNQEASESDSQVEEITPETDSTESTEDIVMFHNGVGSMCLDALDFFGQEGLAYTEYLVTDLDFTTKLKEFTSEFDGVSEGVSASFSYYPIIFIGDRAFSGFNEVVGTEIRQLAI